MTSTSPRFSLLQIIDQSDGFPYPSDPRLAELDFFTFIVDTQPIGRIHASTIPHLANYNQIDRPVFHLTDNTVSFMPWLTDYHSRSDAIAQMLVCTPSCLFSHDMILGD
jgi:hypothetical protein